MPDAIAQLCQLIAEKLRDAPEATSAEVMAHVTGAIAANPQLQAALQADPQMQQTNQDGATGYQTVVKGGTVYIGSTHYSLADPEKFQAALKGVLQELQKLDQPVGIPKNLPDRTRQFVGREADMATLHELLQQTQRVYIQGMGGIGKTELALQYAWQHYEQTTYPAGICWLRSREQDLGTQIVNFARVHLGLKIRDDLERLEEKVADCWQRWPAGQVLVIFDDVTDYRDIQPFLPPQESRLQVLLTTRSYLGQSLKRFEIQVLSEPAALNLWRSMTGAERIEGQLAAVQSLAQWLGYLPLGLELVGRYLAAKPDLPLVELQQRLERQRLGAKALVQREVGMTATHESVAAAFALSWQELAEPARQLSYLLSLFALAPIPWSLVEQSLPEWDSEELEDRRDFDLVDRSLLQRVGTGTYQLHQLIREFFVAQREAAPAAQASPVTALKHAFCQVIVAVAKQLPASPTQQEIFSITPAIPHVAEAATTLQAWVKDTDLAWSYVGLGRFYDGQGAYSQAEPWYEQCLSSVQTRFGTEHPDVASSLNNLAALYQSQGRYEDAEPLYVQALEMRQRLLGSEHPDVAQSLNNLAALYQSQGRYEDAESSYVQALKMNQQLFGREHSDVALSLNNLASLYKSQRRYEDAEPLHVQALEMRQRLLGAEHPDVAQSLNNLAALYQSQGRYEDAESLYVQALEMNQRILGQEHLDVASSLNNLAELYRSQGRYEFAEPLYVQALAIHQRVLGQAHPDVASSLNNLAALYFSQRRYESAEPLLVQALEMKQRLLGQAHPDVASSLNNLAALYFSQRRYESTEPLLVQALEMRQRLLGQAHPDVAQSLNNLAELYRSQGRYEDAEPLLVQALEMRQRLLGQAHPDVAQSLNNLALLYSSQGRYESAESLLVQALEMNQQMLGQEHPTVAVGLHNLVGFYSSQGRYEAAEALYLQAIALAMQTLGESHPNTTTIRNNFLELLKQAIQAGQAAMLSNHPLTQELIQQLQKATIRSRRPAWLSWLLS